MKRLLRFTKRYWILCALLIGSLALLAIFHRPLLIRIGSVPIHEDELQPSDLIVVLSGGLPDIHYGVDLYHQGLAPKMLFIGHFPVELIVESKEPFEVVERPWDEVAGHLAINAGVDAENILYSNVFNGSTYERVQSFLNVAHEHEFESIIVIVNLIHSRRVRYSANLILKGQPPEIRMAPTRQSYYPEFYRFDVENWWTDEADLKAVFEEYVRSAYYWIKYGI